MEINTYSVLLSTGSEFDFFIRNDCGLVDLVDAFVAPHRALFSGDIRASSPRIRLFFLPAIPKWHRKGISRRLLVVIITF